MNTCIKCGAPVPDNARFCGKCGYPVGGGAGTGGRPMSQQPVSGNTPPSGGPYPGGPNSFQPDNDPYGQPPRRTNQDFNSYDQNGYDAFSRNGAFDRGGGRGYSEKGRKRGNDSFGRDPAGYGYPPARKKGKGGLIALIAALVALVAAAAVVIFVFDPFGIIKKHGKVETAVRNTIESVPIVSSLHVSDILNKGKFTLSADFTMEGVKANAVFAQNPSSKEQSMSLTASGEGQQLSLKEYLNKDAVYLDPGAGTVFKYGYNEKKNGYLFTADPSASMYAGIIDIFLKFYVDNMNGEKLEKGLIKTIEDDLRALPAVNLDKKDFEIDGKTQSLTGKCISLTPADMKKIVNDIKSDPVIYDLFSAIAQLSGQSNPLDEIDSTNYERMGTLKISVYLYKNRIGALEITPENAEDDPGVLTVLFKGKEAFDNVSVSMIYKTRPEELMATVLTEKTSTMTKLSLNIEGDTLYAKHENNVLTIGTQRAGAPELTAITCGLTASKDSITISDIRFNWDSDLLHSFSYNRPPFNELLGTLKLKKGADIEKVNTSGAFDLGNATQDQLNGMSEDQLGSLASLF